MPEGALARPHGVGENKVITATANVSDGGTYDTGLQSVDHAVAEAENNDAGTTMNIDSVASTSGGVVTFDCGEPDGTATGAANSTSHDVTVIAVGE